MENTLEAFISDLSGYVFENLTINYYKEPRTTIYNVNENQTPINQTPIRINQSRVQEERIAPPSFYPDENRDNNLGRTLTSRTIPRTGYFSQYPATSQPPPPPPRPIRPPTLPNRRSATFGSTPLNYTNRYSRNNFQTPTFNLHPSVINESFGTRNYTLRPPPGVNIHSTNRTSTNIRSINSQRLPTIVPTTAPTTAPTTTSTIAPTTTPTTAPIRTPTEELTQTLTTRTNTLLNRNSNNVIPIHIELTDSISGSSINNGDIFSDIDTLSALATSLANIDALTIDGLTVNEIIDKTETCLYKDLKDDNPDEIKCHICNEDYTDLDICRKNKICGHFFHQHCIDNWYSNKKKCPICNQYI